MGLVEDISLYADELRTIAVAGKKWSHGDPYDEERYAHVLTVAAKLLALVDPRTPDVIEKALFPQLTHQAPVPVGDAAVFDEQDRILLIRRADDGLWAMPGGALEMGETPAQGVKREALEEAGARITVTGLVGVYDSRFCETRSRVQLYMFLFHCRLVEQRPEWATTPDEVLDVAWFSGDSLPALSPGHTVRVPAALSYHRRSDSAFFDGI